MSELTEAQRTPAQLDAVAEPVVAVVVAVREGAATLGRCLRGVLDQSVPGGIEVAVAVAPSSDRTAEVAAEAAAGDQRVRVVANPSGTTPAGLNAAIAATGAPVIARVDAHAELPPGYLERALNTLSRTRAANVGGVQRPVGDGPFGEAVAAAMASRYGAGGATYRSGGDEGPVDTVYLGVFCRAALDEVGGFDEALLRNQDYELNWRLRAAGHVVWFDPGLVVAYRPRSSPGALARQYFDYGRWKAEVLRLHPRSLRWRQLVAPVTTVVVVGTSALGADRRRRWALAGPAGYALVTTAVAVRLDARPVRAARVASAFAVMHHAWGAGLLAGLVRRPTRRRRIRRWPIRRRPTRRRPSQRWRSQRRASEPAGRSTRATPGALRARTLVGGVRRSG